MLSPFFPRGGALGEGGSSDLPMSPALPDQLRHARSTPALRAITPVGQRNPTLSSTSEVSRAALLSPASPNSANFTPSQAESPLSLLKVSRVATVVSPKQSDSASSSAPESDSSFAQKIRFRLSSVTRKPVALPFLQISHPFRTDDTKKLEQEVKARVTDQARTMSNSTRANASNASNGLDAMKFFATSELEPLPSDPQLVIKPQKYLSGKTFFKDGLAKAHKKIFGKSKEYEDSQSDTSADEEEEDVNLIYSNVMVPLEFPTAEDEENGFTIVSPVEIHHKNNTNAPSARKKFTSLPTQRTTQHQPQRATHLSSLHVPLSSTISSSSN